MSCGRSTAPARRISLSRRAYLPRPGAHYPLVAPPGKSAHVSGSGSITIRHANRRRFVQPGSRHPRLSGSGAPVMIRAASCGPTARSGIVPAGISMMTANWTGESERGGYDYPPLARHNHPCWSWQKEEYQQQLSYLAPERALTPVASARSQQARPVSDPKYVEWPRQPRVRSLNAAGSL